MSKYLEIIKTEKVIPVIKIDNAADILPLLDALRSGGINIAEITFRTSCAAEALANAVKECKDMTIGAGTVINVEQAELAAELGASFIVSPGFSPDIAKYCNLTGILYIPGCVNPTDIMAALFYKLTTVKFFPAENYGGVRTLKALSAAFPSVSFIPTGGITKANINEYLAFDKVIACGASWPVKDELIAEGMFDKITELSRELREILS